MEKPILFNTDMVRAILDGRKSRTSRPIKPQPQKSVEPGPLDAKPFAIWVDYSRWIKPQYQIGDVLWVRETWGKDNNGEYVYRTNYGTTEDDSFPPSLYKWRPSIHMLKEAARIFLKVTDVKLQRLQDITEEEAMKEGCAAIRDKDGITFISAKGRFHMFWDSIYAKQGYGWDANPWVWVYEFEGMEGYNDRNMD